MVAQANSSGDKPHVPLGGDYWTSDPEVPDWGFVDTHAHLMAHLAFGGEAFWGDPYDPDIPGEEGMVHALRSCAPIHGGLIDINPEIGHPAAGGWPEFIIWPRFTTLVHQQAYIDWIYRAYQGGLRLVTALAVNNELLATKTSSHSETTDDKSAILAQVAGMKDMEAHIDQLAGGEGKGWMRIVYSPEEARQAILENKLAVVLGVEVDSLGNWRRREDIDEISGGDMEVARELIAKEVNWLYQLGVRQITPIHLSNNAFGGTAIYMRFLETNNVFLTGEHWDVEDAWSTGVRYRLDEDGDDFKDDVERAIVSSGGRKQKMHRRSLIDYIPGINSLYEALEAPKMRGGHANTRGLNEYGVILLDELMKHGILIDVDHMSEKATDAALTLAEQHQYPVLCSHTWFRDLLYTADTEFDNSKHEIFGTNDVHKVAHEAGKRGDQIERIAKLGGFVSPIINQGDIAGLKRVLPELASKVPEPCAGSSTSWAQAYLYATQKMGGRGVGIGTDINGAAGLPCPRFGVFAAYGANGDKTRILQRRGEIERQSNGVRYNDPIRDYRWHRFESRLDGGYNDEEEDIWQGIAQYYAGYNPWIHKHPKNDYPEPSVMHAREMVNVVHDQVYVDNITQGLIAGDLRIEVDHQQVENWPVEQRAAYLAKRGMIAMGDSDREKVTEIAGKVKAILVKWDEMSGDNLPLSRSTAGLRRDFDINLDGVAHYGMLPDFLQDLRNVGLSAEDLAPLFRSAHDYVEMWMKCEQRAAEVRKGAQSKEDQAVDVSPA